MYSAEVLSNFFYISFGTTCIASVFISMRLVAEERQTGTLVLLTSSPVHDWEIILGKYLSALAFLAIVTVATRLHPGAHLRERQGVVGHLFAGYLGVCCWSAARRWRSACSARRLARNQVLAVIFSARHHRWSSCSRTCWRG